MKVQLIVIQNDKDHEEALAEISRLMNSTSPADRAHLVAQARLIEAYERERWPRRPVPLPHLLEFLMEQHGLERSDLIPLFGTASRVSEVMNGKRELSMSMVKRLMQRFRVPADLLVASGARG